MLIRVIFIILMTTCVVQERDAVLAIVASVLHLGNISFTHGDMDNAMLLDERSEDAMYIVAELMQVSSRATVPLASCQICFVIKCVSVSRCISRADTQSLKRLSICFFFAFLHSVASSPLPAVKSSQTAWKCDSIYHILQDLCANLSCVAVLKSLLNALP